MTVFFNNCCFPMYKFFCYLLHVSNQLFRILVWKLFGDFSSTARHNYPLYLHNVKLIALTFHMQHQKPRDGLNWALPCEQSSTHQVGSRLQTSYSLPLAFIAPLWSTLTIYKREGKRKINQVLLAPSTTVKHILIHKKASLILTRMSTEFF